MHHYPPGRVNTARETESTSKVGEGEQRLPLHVTPCHQSERFNPASHGKDPPISALSNAALAERYLQENGPMCGEPSAGEYVVELLHRAIRHGDQDARYWVQHCLGDCIRGWLHRHHNREAVSLLEGEEHYITRTFERFWQGAADRQIAVGTLSQALDYLYVCLNAAVLNERRVCSWPKQVPLPEPGGTGEPREEDDTGSSKLWRLLQQILPKEREQRLAYLLFHCGLSPREIIRLCPQEFGDAHEIHRLRHRIMERLLHSATQLTGES